MTDDLPAGEHGGKGRTEENGEDGGGSVGAEPVQRPPAVTASQAMVAVCVLLVVVFLIGFLLGRTG